ncbi:beta-eliminating lyase-related protein [Gorillibacterium sp. CAU 1737]|uniref:threonine aldolase family protein n=1 Tax=Gorillibacterium sp. CAU 1737 TaxID=3140362 RepID=UPI003260A268
MIDEKSLMRSYMTAANQLGGHGKWKVGMLKDAFAEVEGSLGADVYGRGPHIEPFQAEMAGLLGKEAAVFFPSGTMAQQIALRIWSDQVGCKRVAYHPLCHLEIHEQDGLKELHHLEPLLLADKDRLITLEDVLAIEGDLSCLLLELPQREIGGQLPPFGELEAISAHCRERGIRLHLDGARLFEILPYYGKTAAEVCQLFDSVYISFYKGIGAVAGAILAGPEAFTEQSKIWKRRHGGDLISLYPYIISSAYYFRQRIGKMGLYYEGAKELAALFNSCPHVSTLPKVPVSNMFHVHIALAKEKLEPILASVQVETGIGITRYLKETEDGINSFEVSIGDAYSAIPQEETRKVFRLLAQRLEESDR